MMTGVDALSDCNNSLNILVSPLVNCKLMPLYENGLEICLKQLGRLATPTQLMQLVKFRPL